MSGMIPELVFGMGFAVSFGYTNTFAGMNNGRDSRGVFEDIWMNTQIGVDELDRDDYREDWEQIEEGETLMNDDDSMAWRG